MSTTSEIVERLRGVRGAMLDWAEDFRRAGSIDGEMSEKSRAALLGEAADRLSELERENARLREALKEARSTIASVTMLDMSKGDVPMHPKMLAMIDAALAGSGEKR
jgi:hypothetical protein